MHLLLHDLVHQITLDFNTKHHNYTVFGIPLLS